MAELALEHFPDHGAALRTLARAKVQLGAQDEAIRIGERIYTLRYAFNLREGLDPMTFTFPDRVLGNPAPDGGPHAGIALDEATLVADFLDAIGWKDTGGKPPEERLLALGLDDVATDLWG